MPCPHCESRFRDRYGLRKHLPIHENDGTAKDLLSDSVPLPTWDPPSQSLYSEPSSPAEYDEVETPPEPDPIEEILEENDDEGMMTGPIPCQPEEENYSFDEQMEMKLAHRPGPKPAAPALRKRQFDFPKYHSQCFDCFLCNSKFGLKQFCIHVKGHAAELQALKEQAMSSLEMYETAAERINATIASLVMQEETG